MNQVRHIAMTPTALSIPSGYGELLTVCNRVVIDDSLDGCVVSIHYPDPRDDYSVGGADIAETINKAIDVARKRK